MAKYDYCSGKEFAELVKDCFASAVQATVMGMDCADVESDEAAFIIKGMSAMAQLILHRLEVTKERNDG